MAWDVAENKVSWSETLYNIYGLDKRSFKATFEGYQERLHPEDRQRVYELITRMLSTKEDALFEERIIRPDGELRYLRSWGKVKTDEAGNPFKMIGARLDITDSKLAEERLKKHITAIEEQNKHLQDISWIQSHVVRAPLARVLGLIELFNIYKADEIDKQGLLSDIATAAKELDNIIKDVSLKTEQIVANKVISGS